MWGQGVSSKVGGGGFMPGPVNYPTGGTGKQSKIIMPASVKQLLECQDDTLKIEGFEAHFVTIVGLVRVIETTTTKVSVYIDDQTGTIECVNYVGAEGDTANEPIVLCEGSYGRVTGTIRTANGRKYLIIFQSESVKDLNEITCHGLEVIQASIKLKKLRMSESNKTRHGGPLDNTFSNYMKEGGFNGAAVASGTLIDGGNQELTANQSLLLGVISSARDDVGMHKDKIFAELKDQIPKTEIIDILEFLSNEGHVYSTVDDDHYKSTHQPSTS